MDKIYVAISLDSLWSLGDALTEIHYLSFILDSITLNDTTTLAKISYIDRIYRVEYLILGLLNAENDRKLTGGVPVLRVLLRAILLYIYTSLRETPVGSGNRQRLVKYLMHDLKQTDILLLFETCPAEMLWILFLGGSVAMAGPYRLWFIAQLVPLFHRAGVDSWGNASCWIDSFLWLERPCVQRMKLLWDELRICYHVL